MTQKDRFETVLAKAYADRMAVLETITEAEALLSERGYEHLDGQLWGKHGARAWLVPLQNSFRTDNGATVREQRQVGYLITWGEHPPQMPVYYMGLKVVD